jgi:hypothetical protein
MLMLTCKQVSNALAKTDYESMSWLQRASLKFHVAICVVCGKYNRQVMLMQDVARGYRKHEDELLAKPEAGCLTCCDKEAIKQALRQKS